MATSLYYVNVDLNLMVWAESEEDAKRVAERYADEEIWNSVMSATGLDEMNYIPSEWEHSVPYGQAPRKYDSMTVREVFDKIEKDREAQELNNYIDPNQLELFA